jgi:hypothetical protein
MGYDGKYGQVTTEYGSIPADEPVIVFRARDITTVDLLGYYVLRCVKKGSPRRHLLLVIAAIERFRRWQAANPDKVRVPTSAGSRAWLGDDRLSVREEES